MDCYDPNKLRRQNPPQCASQAMSLDLPELSQHSTPTTQGAPWVTSCKGISHLNSELKTKMPSCSAKKSTSCLHRELQPETQFSLVAVDAKIAELGGLSELQSHTSALAWAAETCEVDQERWDKLILIVFV